MTDNCLIEVAFPLKHLSLDSMHEKNVQHGHISMLRVVDWNVKIVEKPTCRSVYLSEGAEAQRSL